MSDPRFAESVGTNEVAGLAVAFKALVIRAGGRVEITEAELLAARVTLCRVSADPEVMVVEVAEGEPPDVPRFEAAVSALRERPMVLDLRRRGYDATLWVEQRGDHYTADLRIRVPALGRPVEAE